MAFAGILKCSEVQWFPLQEHIFGGGIGYPIIIQCSAMKLPGRKGSMKKSAIPATKGWGFCACVFSFSITK
jgi:hypothetical protein